ncbi:hypothetical protein ACS5PN_02110 [Roseateles sp. NT4]|uniref:hypothetical protein n=1 Tax=Roseateles sp. NT4 TaxID=3453715 RepID=UPI003EEB61B7
MIDAIEPTPSTPTRAVARTLWQTLGTWIVRLFIVSAGLFVGAIVGLFVALLTGLIQFSC